MNAWIQKHGRTIGGLYGIASAAAFWFDLKHVGLALAGCALVSVALAEGTDWVESFKKRIQRALPRVRANLAAAPLRRMTAALAKHEYRFQGNGDNRARLPFAAQPRALKVGDQLVSGDFVLAPPREGYNGSVILKLTGGANGHEIEVASRLPIAIWPRKD